MAKLLSKAATAVFFNSCGVSLDKVFTGGAVVHAGALAPVVAHIRLSTFVSESSLLFITAFSSNDASVAVVYGFSTRLFGRSLVVSALGVNANLHTIRPLYFNAWWYEREVHEMFGTAFVNSTDTRNLLLQYGMAEHPMKKTVSSNAGVWVLDAAQVGFALKNV